MSKIAVILIVLFITVTVSYADIYRYIDDNGVVCYTDAPFGRKVEKVIKDRSNMQTSSEKDGLDLSHYVKKAAAKYNIEPSLIHAVIKTESNGNHRAISRKGAMGLMQLMPATAYDMNVMNPFNPEQNIEGGTRYLKYLIEKFNGNLTLALAAYNSGPKTVERYGTIPPIAETKNYINKIFSLYNGKKTYTTSVNSGSTKEIKSTPIYKIVLEDGTLLFTNSLFTRSGNSGF